MSSSSDHWLDRHQVVLCLGSGGVGKTTVAAALAITLARQGERVVVLTIDPARRLADALGIDEGLGNEPAPVDLAGASGQLWATMLDPTETFESVVRAEAQSVEQAERILTNPLFHNLTRSLSGTSEYMAAERLHQLYHDDRFDRVVVDTPPSRHVLDFLDSPNQLTRFINHRLYRSVFAPRSGLLRTMSAGGQLALRLLGRIVGSRLVDDVVTFFANFEGLDSGFRRRAEEIDAVLMEETSFVLVTSPRHQPLREAAWISANVAQRLATERPIDELVVNRICPVVIGDEGASPDGPGGEPPAGDARQSDSSADDPLLVNYRQLQALAGQERALVDNFLHHTEAVGRIDGPILLTERYQPVNDLDGLEGLAVDLLGQLGPESA